MDKITQIAVDGETYAINDHRIEEVSNVMGSSTEKVMSQKAVTDALSFHFADYGVPVVYFDGDISAMTKDNAVTLNYRYGDRSGTCTLKWQGTSSIAYPKKNYTVKFDNAFEAVEGWGEEKKYCLKADWVDFSHCRNVVSAKLWGDVVRSRASSDLVTRLSALPNCGAIDGFPCFVVINGEWKGIYNFNIPKDGWMMGMGRGTKEAILCAEGVVCQAETFQKEAELGVDFEVEYSSDGWAESEIQESLNRLIRAVMNSDGTDIDTTIAQYLDIGSAIDYFIFSQLIAHHDGISKNYLISTYDGVKWFFTAYDMDGTFGLLWSGKEFLPATTLTGLGHKLYDLLYYNKFDEFMARFNELIGGVMSTASVDYRFANYAANIPLAAHIAEAKLWTEIPNTEANNVNQISPWYADAVKSETARYAKKNKTDGSHGLIYSDWLCLGFGSCMEENIVIASRRNKYSDIYGIADNAFMSNTIIKSVVIPNGHNRVLGSAFKNCTSLESVVFEGSIDIFGSGAFMNTAIKTFILPEPSSRNNNVVGDYLFCECEKLERISLPKTLPKISEWMFYGCSVLKDIFYGGTMAEWDALEKGDKWNDGTGAYTVHCSDGDVAKA